jgi:pimeloyl-ACP methyl ester carboxylesterase/predicted ester cyclase
VTALAAAVPLAYDERGQGLAVVFLHGLTFDRHTWAPIVERLGEDFRCVTVDLPGHGESPGPPCPLSDVAERIHRLLDGLAIERPVLVGHSMGAVVASLYAASYQVAGVVHVDQSLDLRPFAQGVHRLRDSLQGDGFAEAFEPYRQSMGVDHLPESERRRISARQRVDQHVVMGYFDEVLRTTPETLQGAVQEAATAVRAPWLGVYGQDLPPAARQLLFQCVPGAELEEWPGRGHLVHLAEPDRFAARVAAFARHCGDPSLPYDATRESNVALLMGLHGRCVNSHDLDALDLYTDNPRVVASVTRTVSGFPDLSCRVEWVTAEGDMVTAWLHLEGTHLREWRGFEATGRRVSVRGSLTVKIDGGKVVDFWLCADWLRMYRQLGLATA